MEEEDEAFSFLYIQLAICLYMQRPRTLSSNEQKEGKKPTYISLQFQKPNHLQCLLDIGDFLAEALCAPCRVHFHELVLGDHLLERAKGGFDLCP